MRRVVITGIGTVNSLGLNVDETWSKLIAGESGIKEISSFDTSGFACKVAGEIRDFNPELYIEKKEIKKLGRFTQLALAATKMAVNDSHLVIDENNNKKVGIIVSSGIGGMEIMEKSYSTLINKGAKRVSPFTVPAMIENMATGVLAIHTGAKGVCKSVVTACATGSNSIGDAFETIQLNKADVMIAGGSDACITPLTIAAFAAAKTLATKYNDTPKKASRPFDAARDGFVMGEGAGILILEELDHALKRGAKIYAEIVGYGESNDAYHLTSPSPTGEGAVEAVDRALEQAGISSNKIDYINAHGTGTKANDSSETKVFKKVFGENINEISISSTKGAIGHTLGAAGAIEAIFSILAINNSVLPPTINLENRDKNCDLDYTPIYSRNKKIDYALSSSFGFGGHNSVLIFKKYK